MSKYPIIVFEGIEGSGKSFHIRNLEKYLKKKKIKYLKLREPGGSKNSEKIRNLILNKKSNFKKITDLFLYLAARNENYETIIKKNYKKKLILIDRFIDSTIAYQHYGMGVNKKIIIMLNKFILKNLKPSFTFLNTVNMKNLKSRINKRSNKNRYDKFDIKFYQKVQKGYLKLSKNKKKYMIINSNNEINENKKIIIKKIDTFF
tara:strand:+ start:455 stop:1066 length:612 start_codon:yes stop_codon:yes gene_type:complete